MTDREKEDDVLAGEYYQGKACAERGGYRSDCPHAENSERWDAWHAGFDDEDEILTLTGKGCERLRRAKNPTMQAAFEKAMGR